jgi:hypothetical protein
MKGRIVKSSNSGKSVDNHVEYGMKELPLWWSFDVVELRL